MSALPPKADMLSVGIDVCKVPKADTRRLAPTDLLNSLQGSRDREESPQTFVVQCLRGDVRRTHSRTHSLQLFRKFVGENFELVNLGCLVKQITGLGFFH